MTSSRVSEITRTLFNSVMGSQRHSQSVAEYINIPQKVISPILEFKKNHSEAQKNTKDKSEEELEELVKKSKIVLEDVFKQKNKYNISFKQLKDIILKNTASSVFVSLVYNLMSQTIGINDSWMIYEIIGAFDQLNLHQKNIFYFDILNKCRKIQQKSVEIIHVDQDLLGAKEEVVEEWFGSVKHFFGGFVSSSNDRFLFEPTVVEFFESFLELIMRDCLNKKKGKKVTFFEK